MEQTGGFLRNALFIPKPMKFSFATIFLRHIWLSKCNNKISCLCSEEIDALMPLLVEKIYFLCTILYFLAMDMTGLMIKALMSENLVTLHVLISSKLSLCDLKGGSPWIVLTSCMYYTIPACSFLRFCNLFICTRTC